MILRPSGPSKERTANCGGEWETGASMRSLFQSENRARRPHRTMHLCPDDAELKNRGVARLPHVPAAMGVCPGATVGSLAFRAMSTAPRRHLDSGHRSKFETCYK